MAKMLFIVSLLALLMSPLARAEEPQLASSLISHKASGFDFESPDVKSFSRTTHCIRWYVRRAWSMQTWTVATWSDDGPVTLVRQATADNLVADADHHYRNLITLKRVPPSEVYTFKVITGEPTIRQALSLMWSALERNTYYENEEKWFESDSLYIETYDCKGLQRAFELDALKHPYCGSDLDAIAGAIDGYVSANYREQFLYLYLYQIMIIFPRSTPEDCRKAKADFEKTEHPEEKLKILHSALLAMRKNEGSVLNYKPSAAEGAQQERPAIHPPGEKMRRPCPAYYCDPVTQKAS